MLLPVLITAAIVGGLVVTSPTVRRKMSGGASGAGASASGSLTDRMRDYFDNAGKRTAAQNADILDGLARDFRAAGMIKEADDAARLAASIRAGAAAKGGR